MHLIPHTHDDVGWVKTIDEYFLGFSKYGGTSNVKQILDEVLQQLLVDPKRRFTYTEMKFFTMWYTRLSADDKDKVKKVIKNGQLEIVQGGWSATDEACPNYEDMINNMYIGHSFLKKEFGIRPKIGWMLDAFGHSATNARLFTEFGFEAIFFARLDDKDRDERMKNKELTFLWRTSPDNFGKSRQILGLTTPIHYEPLPQFNTFGTYDPMLAADPIQDDFSLTNGNLLNKTVSIINTIIKLSKIQRSEENVWHL